MPWPEGVGRVALDHCDSTMAEARRRADAGAPPPLWVLARSQSAGRGRRGRPWISPEGNFAASLVLPAPEEPGRAALTSFAAALALHDALSDLGAPGLALKWPNDVLAEGCKIAGILLESETGPRGPVLVVGIGVNLAVAPPAQALEARALPPVDLATLTGRRTEPEAFLEALAAPMARWCATLQAAGFAPLRAAWLERAAGLGGPLTARLGAQEHTGTFRDLDPDGALVLATATGDKRIYAGEIYLV